MKRYLRNAIAYAVIGILLLIIGIIWYNLNAKARLTGINMLCCAACFEFVALINYIKHKKGDEDL